MKVLTERNTVEKLLTSYSHIPTGSIDLSFVQNFSSLKCIHLTVSAVIQVNIFNIGLLTQLPQLIECHLYMIENDHHFIVNAVESAKHLSILNIKWRKGELIPYLYSQLLQIRLEHVSPLVIKIVRKSLKKCLTRLSENYRADVIMICAV